MSEFTEAEMMIRLRGRYSPPEWALLPQVRSATGAGARTTADAIAMNMWPSKGCEIHGIEIKVSRSDWLRELKNGRKADQVARYCHRWWIVAPRGIVEEGELPAGWGLIHTWGDGLRKEVTAPLQETTPLDAPFVAAILRRAQAEHEDESAIRAAERAAYERARKEERKRCEADIENYKNRHDRLLEQVKDFQEGTGLTVLGSWRGDARIREVAQAVKMTRELNPSRHDAAIARLKRARNEARRVVDALDPLLEETE
ncbi:MAG: hypothetical protein ACODAA_00915 [Gemmatimonadota bacterium]